MISDTANDFFLEEGRETQGENKGRTDNDTQRKIVRQQERWENTREGETFKNKTENIIKHHDSRILIINTVILL